MTAPHTSSTTTTLQLIAYWTIVGIPLAWGVYQTALKSRVLFAEQPAAVAAASPPAAGR